MHELDELEKLNQMKESTNAREGVAEKLQQRWNDIVCVFFLFLLLCLAMA
jgi:hypothetical protein